MIQPTIGGGSGNGIRYTCEYFFALKRHGEEDEAAICQALFRCENNDQGTLFRSPTDLGQNGPDDYIARIAISPFVSEPYASQFPARFLLHWDQTGGFFVNSGEKSLSAWFQRMPQLRAHALYALGRTPSLIERLFWVAAIIQSSFSKKQDSKILGWYLLKVKSHYLKKFWSYMLKRHYPEGGIGQVLAEYFQSKHPSSQYLWGVFE